MLEINLIRYRSKKKKRWRIFFCFVLVVFSSYLSYKKFLVKPIPPSLKVQPVRFLSSIAATIPLDELQLMGYLEYHSFFKAFLKLPNGELKEVKQGTIIGKENARILRLNKQHMVIEVNGLEIIKKYAL